MTVQSTSLRWASGCFQRGNGDVPGTYTANYRLSDLIEQDLISSDAARQFLAAAGLVDCVWQMTWADDSLTPTEDLETRLASGHGYVIFIHGWTGNHTIWESIPSLVAANDRRGGSLTAVWAHRGPPRRPRRWIRAIRLPRCARLNCWLICWDYDNCQSRK